MTPLPLLREKNIAWDWITKTTAVKIKMSCVIGTVMMEIIEIEFNRKKKYLFFSNQVWN